ncbi:phage shock protein PspA [Colwellia sp. 4_MG-2023]|uniref:phage shock protein PspA n=1 Tax=unclassified Colwellia TaxID=196834 RepID=UPI0026E3DC0D|nr:MULTISPECIES: phage shock protein PspA [unclassified Colwellia]MDO6506098.1 phage shock protein PspA [Colwellia sp. 5_MG-2023]MDO6554842.1 phage shock protein PspA [Colwellia sp. 4_MG-2023]
MGLFTRFTDIVNANLNSMLDKAEHPEKMIRLIIQEMEETLVEVRATAAKNIAEQKTHKRRVKFAEDSVEQWQSKAELAIAKDREDLAKSALAQKHKYQNELNSLQQESDAFAEFSIKVQEDAARLQEKLSEARRRQEAFTLRQESVHVRLKVRENAAIYNIDEAMSKFERYQQKIDRAEAQVEAYDLMAASKEGQSLDAQFADMEKEEAITQELAKIKQKLSAA